MDRCRNINNTVYKYYGKRGITVCDEWHDAATFADWAFNNGWAKGLCLDRIDTNGDYCPENCRWTTPAENAINQRVRKDNKTGYRGVHYDKYKKCYVGLISVNGKRVNVGTHKSDPRHVALLRDKFIIDNNLSHKLSIID